MASTSDEGTRAQARVGTLPWHAWRALLGLGVAALATADHGAALSAPAPEEPREVTIGATDRMRVALTFHCGPWVADGTLESILATLDGAGVRSTFFVTGQFIERHPDLFAAVAARHELGNHSYSHPSFPSLTAAQQRRELERTEALAEAAGHSTRPLWRAPFGARNPRVVAGAAEVGWPVHVFWSLLRTPRGWVTGDSGDWRDIAAQDVLQNVLAAVDQIGPATILVHHCNSGLTAEVLPAILQGLAERGFESVPVSVLIETPPG